jgi:hypothetical protein
MSDQRVPINKRSLSPHQKQMRAWTGLSVFVGFLFAVVVLWLVNRQSFSGH